jgi:hypothetical protein
MENKQTAVEYLIINLIKEIGVPPEYTWETVTNILKTAKEIEKKNIQLAYMYGQADPYQIQHKSIEEFYNETF